MSVMADPQPTVQVATRRVATELTGLRERLERVEHGLEVVFIGSETVPTGNSISMLQELDVLQQSVGALADYLNRLCQTVSSDATVNVEEAVQVVPLRDMAARLKGGTTSAEISNDPELF